MKALDEYVLSDGDHVHVVAEQSSCFSNFFCLIGTEEHGGVSVKLYGHVGSLLVFCFTRCVLKQRSAY